jgi:hypothetical protein
VLAEHTEQEHPKQQNDRCRDGEEGDHPRQVFGVWNFHVGLDVADRPGDGGVGRYVGLLRAAGDQLAAQPGPRCNDDLFGRQVCFPAYAAREDDAPRHRREIAADRALYFQGARNQMCVVANSSRRPEQQAPGAPWTKRADGDHRIILDRALDLDVLPAGEQVVQDAVLYDDPVCAGDDHSSTCAFDGDLAANREHVVGDVGADMDTVPREELLLCAIARDAHFAPRRDFSDCRLGDVDSGQHEKHDGEHTLSATHGTRRRLRPDPAFEACAQHACSRHGCLPLRKRRVGHHDNYEINGITRRRTANGVL